MAETEPAIDFTKVAFPTDKLTIKALRENRPHAFDVEPPAKWKHLISGQRSNQFLLMSLDTLLGATLDFERILAEEVFRKELDLPKLAKLPVIGGRLGDLKDSLASSYVSLGVARGKNEAREMLRDIEAQAQEQARRHGGRPR